MEPIIDLFHIVVEFLPLKEHKGQVLMSDK